ncbi:MAG TPA: FtsK/SpoIIIE domain-containing protein [Nocardioidaceae bacterium]|nr:FtsK/SpoIIIE domain-containing protein [Nocardioidaceae bacterium]
MAERARGSGSVRALTARLRGLHASITDLVPTVRQLGNDNYQQALRAYKAAHRAVGNSGPAAGDAVVEATSRVAAEVEPALRELAEELAPGLAGLPPKDPGWRSREFVGAGTARYLRIGQVAGSPDRVLPAVVPLLGTSGWSVVAESKAVAHRLLQSVALRQVGCAEPFRVRVDAFDPHLTGAMGLLGGLTARHPTLASKALHTTFELQALLATLVEISSERAARLNQLGYQSFDELLSDNERAADPYRLVFLFDYPAGIDAQTHRELVRLAATSGQRGLCFVVHHDRSIRPDPEIDPYDFVSLLDSLQLSDDGAEHSLLRRVPLHIDAPFDADTAAAVCELVAAMAEQAVLPTVDFMDTLPDRAEWWAPVRDELSTVVGAGERVPALVRLRTRNPALPHMAVAGAVGQGKSNLLLVLIHGLAARYSPTELQMYLLDFKHGIEFASLGPGDGREHWLPHVRVLGVHSDRDFGLAVLRHLSEELALRSDQFKRRGVSDLSELPLGDDRPPRILVVLDEFQVLLEDDEDSAEEAARLLERLARLGRAYGVHLVLSTQTIEGVGRLATRRDAIFGQVPHRVALKTTPTDSQAILRTGNTAAADLRFRGEAILNHNFGSPDDNQRILVSYADRDALDGLRRDLYVRAFATDLAQPPRVFHLGESASLADVGLDNGSQSTGSVGAWAGMPIAVTEQPTTIEVRPEPGAGVLVLGDGPSSAIGVITGLAVSTARGHGPIASRPPRYLLLDGVAAEESVADAKSALVEALTLLGSEVEIVDGAADIHERLFAVRDAIKQGGWKQRLYVLGLGLHNIQGMKAHAEGRFESPADALTEVVRDGPSAGVITFGWWNRLHVCTDQLGYQRADVAAHIFLRHPRDGVRSVCGPLVRWTSEPHRALVWDGLSPEPITVVPFAPLRVDEVDHLLRGATP